MKKFTFLAYDECKCCLWKQNLSASEPEWTWQRFQGRKCLRAAGRSYVERLSLIHVCILLESYIRISLYKYLDSQMTWFKLTFTDSPGATRVIGCNGIANLSIIRLRMISKQWIKLPVLTQKISLFIIWNLSVCLNVGLKHFYTAFHFWVRCNGWYYASQRSKKAIHEYLILSKWGTW